MHIHSLNCYPDAHKIFIFQFGLMQWLDIAFRSCCTSRVLPQYEYYLQYNPKIKYWLPSFDFFFIQMYGPSITAGSVSRQTRPGNRIRFISQYCLFLNIPTMTTRDGAGPQQWHTYLLTCCFTGRKIENSCAQPFERLQMRKDSMYYRVV
jgi:hypothetical protein